MKKKSAIPGDGGKKNKIERFINNIRKNCSYDARDYQPAVVQEITDE
jgi:hypothetical protein